MPYHRREAAIERFSVLTGLRSVVVPVFDTAPTDRVRRGDPEERRVATGLELTPANTVVACSTPEVAALYERLGFPIARVEADPSRTPRRSGRGTCCCAWPPATRRGASWRTRPRSTCSTATAWSTTVRTVVNDPVVGDEGGLTATRDYRTYVEAFADAARAQVGRGPPVRAARPDRRHRLRRRRGAGAGRPRARACARAT